MRGDLVTRAVSDAGVGHGVAVVAVGVHLHHHRALGACMQLLVCMCGRPCEVKYAVALAGLLILDPVLLLLDEPTSGLDPVAAYELRLLVEESVRRTGATCIWASHDLNSIPPQAKRVVLLKNGRVLFDGDVQKGLSRPWLVRSGLAVPQEGEESF